MKKRADSNAECRRLALEFFNKQQAVKAQLKELEQMKPELEKQLEDYCNSIGTKRLVFENDQCMDGGLVTVRMVERTSVEWDADKLEKRLPKPIAKQVIKKKYTVDNMVGLTRYLKSCGVDPETFKKFIRVERSVDTIELDRLSDLGTVSVRNVSGCYYVKCQKPYFTFSVKKGNGDGAGE